MLGSSSSNCGLIARCTREVVRHATVLDKSGHLITTLGRDAFTVLENGKYGKLFKSGDSTDLAKVIIELLRDRDARDEMAKNGQEYAAKFDWDVVAKDIFEVYEMAIVGSGKVALVSDNRPWNRIWNR